jgi:hypothetical protein
MEIAMRQMTLANQASFEKYARKSRREEFLNVMAAVVPWHELEALVEPHYPKAGNGRRPVGLKVMLRAYFVQQWFTRGVAQLRTHGNRSSFVLERRSYAEFVQLEVSLHFVACWKRPVSSTSVTVAILRSGADKRHDLRPDLSGSAQCAGQDDPGQYRTG